MSDEKYTAEHYERMVADCRHAFSHAILLSREGQQELIDMLRQAGQMMRQQAGRVDDDFSTRESIRAELVKKVGECCAGGDPLCAAGCLVEKAVLSNFKREAALSAKEDGHE